MDYKEQLELFQSNTILSNGRTATKKEDTVPFFKLYKFSSPLDVLLICGGTLTNIICGIMQPFVMILFGEVTGVIADYVGSINQNSTHEEKVIATEKLFFGTHHFAITTLVASVVIIFCTYIGVMCFTYSSTRQSMKIRRLLFGKILDQDVSWHEKNQTENFASTLTNDIFKIEDGIGEKVGELIFIKTAYIASVIWASVSGWNFAMACLVLFPLKTILSAFLPRFWTKYGKQEVAALSAAWIVAKEILLSIKTVVAFSAEERESKRFNQHVTQAQNHNITRCFFNGLNKALYCFLTYSCYGFALWYGVDLVIKDKSLPETEKVYTPGNMMSIYFVTLLATSHFWGGGPQLQAIKKARTTAFKVFKILESGAIMQKHNNDGKRPDFKSDIVLKNVNFCYPTKPDVQVLNDITMKISAGETIAFVGSSKSGKSAVIQLLQRIYDSTSGGISIDEVVLQDIDINYLRENVAVVNKVPSLFTASIADNIRYGKMSASMDDIVRAAKKANAHSFIADLPDGYQMVVDGNEGQLSKAQKLKIALSRALIKEPHLLVLKEVTALLGPDDKIEVQATLDAVLTSLEGCTKIVITDILSTLRKVNRIVVFDDGKIIEEGSHQKLIETKGAYYNMIISGDLIELNKSKHSRLEANSLYAMLYEEGVNKSDNFGKEKKDAHLRSYINLYLRILKFNRQEWLQIIMGFLALIINGTSISIYGLILGEMLGVLSITDNIALKTKTDFYCWRLFYLGVASGTAIFVQIFSFGYTDAKLIGRVRANMFTAMLKQEIGWFDNKENSVRALWLQLAFDPIRMQIVGARIYLTLTLLSILVLSAVISFYLEWRLALIVGIFYSLIILSIFYERKCMNMEVDITRKVSEKSAKIAKEAIGEIDTVKTLGCENVLYESYLKELLYSTTIRSRRWRTRAVILGFARSLQFLVYAGGIAYGALIISKGEVDSAVVFQVLQVMVPSAWTIGYTLSLLPDVQSGISAASRVFTLLERVPAIKSYPNSIRRQWFSRISFSYPTGPPVEVISGFDLSILYGESVTLIGGTVCGKSSIIELLMRFYDPVDGEIKVDEVDIRNIDLHFLRSQLGFVSKEPILFDLTIAENIGYGVNDRQVSMEDIEKAAKFTNIHNFITSLPLGYETRLGANGAQLSKSQKQRISLARVLLRDPKILLLNEVTFGLDDEGKKVVEEVLDKAGQGRTCIVISQNPDIIQKSDVICGFQGRKLVGTVSHDQFIAMRDRYHHKEHSE